MNDDYDRMIEQQRQAERTLHSTSCMLYSLREAFAVTHIPASCWLAWIKEGLIQPVYLSTQFTYTVAGRRQECGEPKPYIDAEQLKDFLASLRDKTVKIGSETVEVTEIGE